MFAFNSCLVCFFVVVSSFVWAHRCDAIKWEFFPLFAFAINAGTGWLCQRRWSLVGVTRISLSTAWERVQCHKSCAAGMAATVAVTAMWSATLDIIAATPCSPFGHLSNTTNAIENQQKDTSTAIYSARNGVAFRTQKWGRRIIYLSLCSRKFNLHCTARSKGCGCEVVQLVCDALCVFNTIISSTAQFSQNMQ